MATHSGDVLISAAAGTLLGASVLAVSWRIFGRCWRKKVIAEDWVMLAAELLYTVSCGVIFRASVIGLGTAHDTELGAQMLRNAKMDVLIFNVFSIAALACAKCSICLTLGRIAIDRKVKIAALAIGIIAIVSGILLFLEKLIRCRPVYEWDSNIPGADCIDNHIVRIAAKLCMIIAVISGMLLASLAAYTTWIHRHRGGNKIVCGFALFIGALATVAGIIRFHWLGTVINMDDFLHNYAPLVALAVVETGLCIIAGSLFVSENLFAAKRPPRIKVTGIKNPGDSLSTGISDTKRFDSLVAPITPSEDGQSMVSAPASAAFLRDIEAEWDEAQLRGTRDLAIITSSATRGSFDLKTVTMGRDVIIINTKLTVTEETVTPMPERTVMNQITSLRTPGYFDQRRDSNHEQWIPILPQEHPPTPME